jgi:integrase
MKGHITKRGDRYLVRLELDAEHDPGSGERIRRRRGGGSYRTRRQAEEALRDALEAGRRGWQGPDRVSVSAFLDEWLAGIEHELAPTTAALYRTICTTYISPRIGARRLDSITAKDLTDLYAALSKGGGRGGKPLAPKTVRHVHGVLRRAFGYAVEARHVTWNPAAAAKPPKMRHGVVGADTVWNADEVRTFLASASEDRLAPLWVLAASSGMRRGELLGVRWGDLDLDGATLQVRSSRVAFGALQVTKEPKTTRSRRTIPLPDRTVEALRTWKARQARERLAAGTAYADLGLVFADELGGYLSPSATSKAFGRLVKAASLPRITLHQVRHSFATIALEQGIDVLYVSELLGHSSAAITQTVYQHSRPERVRAAVDTISKAIEG